VAGAAVSVRLGDGATAGVADGTLVGADEAVSGGLVTAGLPQALARTTNAARIASLEVSTC
jgi:hypothetical protein